MEFLLQRGAKLDCRDFDHWLPLHVAIRFNFPGAVSFLLDKGSDINAQDKEGYSSRPPPVLCSFPIYNSSSFSFSTLFFSFSSSVHPDALRASHDIVQEDWIAQRSSTWTPWAGQHAAPG